PQPVNKQEPQRAIKTGTRTRYEQAEIYSRLPPAVQLGEVIAQEADAEDGGVGSNSQQRHKHPIPTAKRASRCNGKWGWARLRLAGAGVSSGYPLGAGQFVYRSRACPECRERFQAASA